MTERPRWWLIGVAALMAAIFLYQNIGGLGVLLLAAGCIIGYVGFRFFRRVKPSTSGRVRCLTCGATLAPTARNCKNCGSASWTLIQ